MSFSIEDSTARKLWLKKRMKNKTAMKLQRTNSEHRKLLPVCFHDIIVATM